MGARGTGVLALQGDFGAHAKVLAGLGAEVSEVRHAAQLDGLSALVIPGGESTTLLRLMAGEDWFGAIRALVASGGSVLGTCAGAILLAREIRGPSQPSLGLLNAVVERNGYGRQRESFEAEIAAPAFGGTLHGVFIRAPRIVERAPDVEVLATLKDEPVLLRQGRVLAATFHPELAGEDRVHRALLDLAVNRQTPRRAGTKPAARGTEALVAARGD